MLTRLHRRLRGDDGISLVEMMVALSILGVVLSASAGVFTTALVSMQGAESRTRGTALANEELENLRVLPWDAVGFRSEDFDDLGITPPPDTVLLGADNPTRTRAPLPQETLPPRDGVVFTVRREITWVKDSPSVSGDEHYKRLVVHVDWQDRGLPRSTTVESLRSPNPAEQPASEFALSLHEVTPDLVYIDSEGRLDPLKNPQLDLVALTSAKAEFVEVRYQQRGQTDLTVESLLSSDLLNWSKTLTTTHDRRFRNGDVILAFVAKRTPPYTEEVLGQTLVRFLQPVAVRSIDLLPATVCVAADETTPAVEVSTSVDGIVEEDAVTVTWTTGTATAQFASGTVEGSTFTATIPAGSYTDTTEVTVHAERSSDGETATANAATPLTVERSEVCP